MKMHTTSPVFEIDQEKWNTKRPQQPEYEAFYFLTTGKGEGKRVHLWFEHYETAQESFEAFEAVQHMAKRVTLHQTGLTWVEFSADSQDFEAKIVERGLDQLSFPLSLQF